MTHVYRIRLDTMSDVRQFVNIASQYKDLKLTDREHYTINAQSILGVMYSLEWNKIYLESPKDVFTPFYRFIIGTSMRN